MSSKNITRKRPTSPIVRRPSIRIGNATSDIMHGFAKKNARSAKRDYRKVQHQITLDVYSQKAANIAELVRGLSELDNIYHKLKTVQDKKDLREMAERYANSENPNLQRFQENIAFWQRKADDAERTGGKKKSKRTRKSRKSRKSRK